MKFRFQDGEVEAQPGDTIAAALYRSGRRIFSRSFKYHRPRGLLCVSGNCPNCLMNVDGVPNIRTCVTPVRDGMDVRSQNAQPSLENDRLAIVQKMDFMMPVGWYYKVFLSRSMWHRAEPHIRKVAGLGVAGGDEKTEYEHAWMHAQTAVIGGGYAGIQAALEAAGRGESVILVDDQAELGGQARYRKIAGDKTLELLAKLKAQPNCRILQGCYCFGLYEGNLLGVLQPRPHAKAAERLIHLRAPQVVVATGAWETPLPFPNNDLVGVMLSTGAQRLWRLFGVAPGKRAVVVGNQPRAGEVSDDLRAAGTEIVAVVPPQDVVRAIGSDSVQGIEVKGGRHSCDLVIICGPRVPDSALSVQAGGKLAWSEERGAFLPDKVPANVSVVGDAAGESLAAVPIATEASKRAFVCLCSDVTTKDLCDGIAEGFDQIETLKRYTTATMGPCQGRMCQLSSIHICSRETGRTPQATGVTTSRPPNPGVTLGALAGPRHHPIRRTPMHYAHDEAGAVWLDMGDWKRPRYYRSATSQNERACVEEEYRAVRERAGIIDVSTLGKLMVHGRDSGQLLDKVYTHRFSDLKPGRVRYALMCDEGGIILDDGTVSRLGSDRYFITTTTGNLDFVNQWFDDRANRISLGLLGLLAHNMFDFAALLPGISLLATGMFALRSGLFAVRSPGSPRIARTVLLILAILQVPAALWSARGAAADVASAALSASPSEPDVVYSAGQAVRRWAPWRADALVADAFAADLAGDDESAAAIAREGAERFPSDGNALRRFGIASIRAGDCETALSSLGRSAQERPADWRTYVAWGEIAHRCHQTEAAISAYDRAFECQSPTRVVDEAYAAFPLGIVWVDKLEDSPARYAARLAALTLRDGDAATAALAWDEAAASDPATYALKIERIQALIAAGRESEAAVVLSAFATKYPNNPQVPALSRQLARADATPGLPQAPIASSRNVLRIRAIEAQDGAAAALAEERRLELLGATNDPELALERARLQLATGDGIGCLATIDVRFLPRDPILGESAARLRDLCQGSLSSKHEDGDGGR